MGLISAFLVLSSLGLAAASSFPDTTSCDAYDPTLGDTVMFWVDPPVRTDAYTLRAGDGCGGDPTSYVPGQFMSIHLRTHRYKGQFRGLLLYATRVGDPTGQRVGDWHFDWPNSNMFWKPSNDVCHNVSLMHLNGAEKYYHHEFMWVAPPAGLGAVEFHCLIKRGEANTGEFYWPNAAGNLVLNEGGATGGNKWYEGAAGSSCTATCQAKGMSCDATLHNNAYQYGSLLQKDVLLTAGCNWPGVELDDTKQILKDSLGWCYYPSQLASAGSDVCNMAAPTGTTPICSCGADGRPSARVGAPRDTTCYNGFVAMGSASRASSSLVSFALMLLAGFWFSGRSSSLFVIALVLGCAHVAQAHNWVYSVSRSFNQASTYKPCRPKVNDSPHWQINQGKLFNMEWATGHDHYFYFTIVAAKDMELLNNVTERDLNDYLDPASCLPQYDYMRSKTGNPQMWEKQHIEYNPNNFDQKDMQGNNIYEKRLNFTDKPRYFDRHEKFGPPSLAQEVRWAYTPNNLVKDLRCSYFNAKFPFLIAVHRFVQVETPMSRAGDRDVAQFTIELSQGHIDRQYGQGSYIVQYLWRGYFDCADVDVFDDSTPVALDLIGGRKLLPNEPQWNKVDHCLFEEIQNVETGCVEVATDSKTVLAMCQNNVNCAGVNVVPLWMPNDVFPLFSNRVAIPWDACDKDLFASLGKGSFVGFGVQPRLPNNTFSSYSVTDDPEDPVFYSTCFVKKPAWKFDLSLETISNTTTVFVPPPWAFSDRCVACDTWKASQESLDVPYWTLPQRCRNCESSTLPPVPAVASYRLAKGQKCDGSWFGGRPAWNFKTPPPQCAGVRCVKTLNLVGTNTISAADCIAKAKRDPSCSESVQHQYSRVNGRDNYECECWIKTNPGCCGECKPVDYYADNWDRTVYSLAKTDVDPTCANGIKSPDNAFCCPKTCGQCLGKPLLQVSFRDKTLADPAGFAVDNGDKYGAHTPTNAQPLGSTLKYGWNCDLSGEAGDNNKPDESDFHNTWMGADFATCGVTPEWTLEVPNATYEVHTLYSRQNQQIAGCKLQGQPNFDVGFDRLSGSSMAWVFRSVDASNGMLKWSAASNTFSCTAIAALRVYPSTTTPVADCRKLDGVCCPQFVEMAARPCSSFSAPCAL